MIGAGTFVNPLLKVLTTVAILVAVYFLIVRPVLDTTDKAFETVSPAFEGIDDVGADVRSSFRQAERIQARQQAASAAQTKEANKLLDCISSATGDVNRIQRCNAKYDPANP
jgi:hypothetical protein